MPVVVKAAGREVHRGELGAGHTRIEIGVPEGRERRVRVEIEAEGRALLDEAVALRPVAARAFHLVPHSHVDIGYSDPQPEVERKQWANLRDALALFRETKDLPPEARFRWQSEGLWAVESFLEQATETERRDFASAGGPRRSRAAGQPHERPHRPVPPARSSPDGRTRRDA